MSKMHLVRNTSKTNKNNTHLLTVAFHDQGSLEAFAFPALNHMISQWVPEKEKSAFVSFAYVGGTFGSIITNPMCGAILATLGWEVRWF